MKKSLLALCAFLSLSIMSQASAATCEAQATEKKLAGAAKTSFLKKCEQDAGTATPSSPQAACEKTAADKKLAGAAKNSFVTKCVKDATASK